MLKHYFKLDLTSEQCRNLKLGRARSALALSSSGK